MLGFLFDTHPGFECYSHFGGRYDDLFLIKAVLSHNSKCPDQPIEISPIIPRGSSIFSFKLKRGDSSLTFLDSSALLPFGLARITESFKVTHVKQTIDYTKIKKITPKLLRYLEYDCRGLYESLEKFWGWDFIKRSGKAQTIASQSLRVLRTFLRGGISSLSDEYDDFSRKSYIGGRVEIFKPFYEGSAKKLYNYDVNSLYPSVMLKHDFPNNFQGETKEYVENELGIYEVIVTVPRMHVPPLGKVRNGKLIFPTGTFRTVCTSAEIEYCKTLGCSFEIIHGHVFSNAGRIFRRFVKKLYAVRLKADRGSVDDIIAKLLLNSCYGKFGQRTDREQIVFDDGSEGLKPFGRDNILSVGTKKYRLMLKDVELDCFSNVAIASFVTAYARIHMHKLYLKCGDSLYYTDTDSIFTTKKLPIGEGLGKLKLEGEFESACFLLPKTYIAGTKIVMKGFEKKKLKDFQLSDFTDALQGEMQALKIKSEPKFATLKTAIRSGNLTSMTKGSTRQIRSVYDKRIMLKSADLNDWKTKPIRLKRKEK